jgi:hypothetical protein
MGKRVGAVDGQDVKDFFVRAKLTSGDFGGRCFRAICRNVGASWHHRTARRYYCEDCAADINLACKLKGEPVLCTRQGTGLSRTY